MPLLDSENSTPIQDTSYLGIFSTHIAKFSFGCMVLSGLFMLYLSMRPCKYDHVCELPPFSIFILFLSLIIAVLSLLGLLLAYIAPKQDTPERMLKRQEGINWNSILFGLSIFYILFFIMAV